MKPLTVTRMIGIWVDSDGTSGVVRGGWYVFCRHCWWVSEIMDQPAAMDAATEHCRSPVRAARFRAFA